MRFGALTPHRQIEGQIRPATDPESHEMLPRRRRRRHRPAPPLPRLSADEQVAADRLLAALTAERPIGNVVSLAAYRARRAR